VPKTNHGSSYESGEAFGSPETLRPPVPPNLRDRGLTSVEASGWS
jgi:hypothetical protein